jgi:hypothetical protein
LTNSLRFSLNDAARARLGREGSPRLPVWSLFVNAPRPTQVVALSTLRSGQTAVICEARLDAEDAALLRAMGLGCNAKVRLCRAGEPCIVALTCGKTGGVTCRVGLSRPLAERILVQLGPAAKPSA